MKLTRSDGQRTAALAACLGVRLTRCDRRSLGAIAAGTAVLVACAPPQRANEVRAHTPTATPKASPPVQPRILYPMADSTVTIPAACSAKCSLDCDVWSGQINCGPRASIEVWGGMSSMARMSLDAKGATVQGQERSPQGVVMKWGVARDQEFCASLAWRSAEAKPTEPYWNWQLCAADNAASRDSILTIAKGFASNGQVGHLIACENLGC